MMLKDIFNTVHSMTALKEYDEFPWSDTVFLKNDADACDENGHALYDEYKIDIPDDPDYEYSDVTFYTLTPRQIEIAYAKGYLTR